VRSIPKRTSRSSKGSVAPPSGRFRPDLAEEFLERCDPSQRAALGQGYDEARSLDSL
jgi:hypothetical protein